MLALIKEHGSAGTSAGEVFSVIEQALRAALCQTALIQSAPRVVMSEEGVPAMFGGLVSPDLINAFATN